MLQRLTDSLASSILIASLLVVLTAAALPTHVIHGHNMLRSSESVISSLDISKCILEGQQSTAGHWEQSSNDSFPDWQDNSNCNYFKYRSTRIPDILGTTTQPLAEYSDSQNREGVVRILFLGDSVDRNWLQAMCFLYDGSVNASYGWRQTPGCSIQEDMEDNKLVPADVDFKDFEKRMDYTMNCLTSCVLPGVEIFHVFLLGVSLNEPFWPFYLKGNYVERLGRAMQQPGFPTSINMVVASSLFWDISRYTHMNNCQEFGCSTFLPEDFLKEYHKNLTTMLHHFQKTLPLARENFHLVFHTTRAPKLHDDDRTVNTALGRGVYYNQLNTVARSVVDKNGWLLLDIAYQLAGLHQDFAIPYDDHHPSNIYLAKNAHVFLCLAAPQHCRVS